MSYPGRNNIYDATIRRMVNEALDTQDREFACNRRNDSDKQLLAYLRFCAQLLGHTPWPREITGGSLIEERFDSWEKALAKAKLPRPLTQDILSEFARYTEEVERQKAVYREKKVAKKQKAQQRLNAQKKKQSV